MSGVFTAVYVLSFTCFGQFCDGLSQPQSMVTTSQQACLFMKDALLRDGGPHKQISAECHGETAAAVSVLRGR